MKQEKLDYTKHCSILFGSYVAAPNEPNHYDSLAPRALECIYLRPLCTAHGGHQLHHIPTKRTITRHRKLTVLPTPSHIVDSINKIAANDSIKDLKIHSKWLDIENAEVYYEGEDENNNINDEDSDSNKDSESDSDSDSDEDGDSDDEDDDTDNQISEVTGQVAGAVHCNNPNDEVVEQEEAVEDDNDNNDNVELRKN